ncbi:MAG TPA: UDP-N-acetylmuramoyl-L-alanine--D-glutamate ligase [Chthoniobacterales bacterium]|nr:UDP-N-acetylmuramoyl-L-alanine--D-glutamate ligase [Chthoniobacterales bacterium]
MKYEGKKVAVLGAGLSGTAAALLLRSEGAQVSVLDSADESKLLKSTIENLRARGITVRSGPGAESDSSPYDLVVLSPGIDPLSPLGSHFLSRQIETIGELELGWRSVDAPVIAITGTNGKTTTTELLAQMLNACGQRTIACGNIGKPLSEVALEDRDLDVLTVEVSSFQLETITSFRPAVSVWLNFAPDHLDRYRSVAEYRAAKLRIFDYQTAEDIAVINAGESLPKVPARTVSFSAYTNQADLRFESGSIVYQNRPVLRMSDTKLRGSHNIENVMAAMAVGIARGLTFEQMLPPLHAYEPRPHRCEFVRDLAGVTYINDSKATNLDAVEKALLSQNRKVVLIAGGKDKGFTFETLRPLVAEKARAVILIGEMASRICADWKDAAPCQIASSLADAVERAHALAQAGEVVLFSPGTSSFDMFKSYADRGDQFRALVRALPK